MRIIPLINLRATDHGNPTVHGRGFATDRRRSWATPEHVLQIAESAMTRLAKLAKATRLA